eukprot:13354217-Alexandrium_andersonii.AAC.1
MAIGIAVLGSVPSCSYCQLCKFLPANGSMTRAASGGLLPPQTPPLPATALRPQRAALYGGAL